MKTSQSAPIKDVTLFDSLGNRCRCQLFQNGAEFELYLQHFNDSAPVRYVGSLALCMNLGQVFLDNKKQAGFEETLESYTQTPKN